MIYFLYDLANSRIKIGTTKSEASLARRLTALRTGNPAIELVYTQPGDRFEESRIHRNYGALRVVGSEWFVYHPRNPIGLYLARVTKLP